MKVIIGTTSKLKIDTVARAIKDIAGVDPDIRGEDVVSGVPDTPWDEQTKLGAENRARKISKADTGIYAIGLESGLVTRYGNTYEEAWCCVIHQNKEYLGYSSGLMLPAIVTQEMAESGEEHGPTLRKIREQLELSNDKDTWGLYTGYQLMRTVSLEEALRNALIQAMGNNKSLYATEQL
jgi:inosine/xanthosine triphosphatase